MIDADPPALRQMIDVYERVDGPVIAVERVPEDHVSSYGIVDVEPAPALGTGVYRIKDLDREAAAVARRRRTWRSSAATSSRPISSPPCVRRAAISPGRFSSPTACGVCCRPAAVCLRGRRRPPRHRQQAGVPEGRGLLRAEAARPGRALPRVSRLAQSDFDEALGFALGLRRRPCCRSWLALARLGLGLRFGLALTLGVCRRAFSRRRGLALAAHWLRCRSCRRARSR